MNFLTSFLTGYLQIAFMLASMLNILKSEWTAKQVLFVAAIVQILVTVLIKTFSLTLLTIYISTLIITFACFALLKQSWRKSIFMGVFANFIFVVIEYILLLLVILLPEAAQVFLLNNLYIPRIIASACSALLYVFSNRFRNTGYLPLENLASIHWILYFLVFGLFADYNLAKLFAFPEISNFPEIIVVVLFLVFFLHNLIHVENMTKMLKIEQRLETQKILEQEIELQRRRNYEQLSATHTKFKSYQDEIEEVMAGIWDMNAIVLTQQGRARQAQAYQALLFRIHQLKQNFNLAYCTGDEILDVVLSSKDDLARKKNIRIRANIDLLADHQFNADIIGSILINILDEAIETVEVIEEIEIEKIILFSLRVEEDFFHIVIENPGDSTASTKELFNHKGVGLQIANRLTERLMGEFHATCEDYWCTVKVKLPRYAMGHTESRSIV